MACRAAGFEARSSPFQTEYSRTVRGLVAAGVGVVLGPSYAAVDALDIVLCARSPSRGSSLAPAALPPGATARPPLLARYDVSRATRLRLSARLAALPGSSRSAAFVTSSERRAGQVASRRRRRGGEAAQAGLRREAWLVAVEPVDRVAVREPLRVGVCERDRGASVQLDRLGMSGRSQDAS